jgi:hypothetical protein
MIKNFLVYAILDIKPIRQMFTYTDFTIMFHLTWLVSWVPQTLWEYCTKLPSSLNHRLSWSLWTANVVSLYSHFFSSIWRMQKIWSVVDLLRRNPHWWSPIISSMYGTNLGRRIFDKILYEVDSSDDRLCGLVVKVLGYRSRGPGSIPGTTRKKSSGSGTGSTQPREYNWGATW